MKEGQAEQLWQLAHSRAAHALEHDAPAIMAQRWGASPWKTEITTMDNAAEIGARRQVGHPRRADAYRDVLVEACSGTPSRCSDTTRLQPQWRTAR